MAQDVYDNYDSPEDDYETEEVEETTPQRQTKQSGKKNPLRELVAQQAAELQVIRQERALLKAGVDPDSPLVPLFLKADDVDWKDPNSVKQAASKYGLINGESGSEDKTTEQQPPPSDHPDAQAFQRLGNASAGSDSPGAAPNADQPWLNAKSPDEFDALYQKFHPRGLTSSDQVS